MPEPTDNEILAGLAAGRDDAFAAVWDRFAARMLAAAWGMLGSRDAAEDAMQDVFVGLVQARERLAGIRDLQAYLFASLRHAAARRRPRPDDPRRRTVEDVEALAPAGEPGPGGARLGAGGTSGISADRAARLERALAHLAELRQRLLTKDE